MKPFRLTTLSAAVLATLFALPALAADPPRAASTTERADLEKAREELREAREELREATRRVAELTAKVGGDSPRMLAYRYLTDPDRAMIGVVLGDDDGKGAVVSAVTPGGPADKAGLRAGDRVTTINLSAVSNEGDPVQDARAKLGKLKAGDKVTLGVERDGKALQLIATAERRASWDWPALAPLAMHGEVLAPMDHNIEVIVENARRHAREAGEHARRAGEDAKGERERAIVWRDKALNARLGALGELRRIVISGGGNFFDLRLADLNPSLGKYFGSSDGVLVLENDGESIQSIQSGDVILSVGGQRTDSSSDVMRALSDRADSKGVNVEVMRDRKRQVLVIDVPARSEFDVFLPAPPLPPEPPAAPAAPGTPRAPAAPRPPAVAPPPPPPPPPASVTL